MLDFPGCRLSSLVTRALKSLLRWGFGMAGTDHDAADRAGQRGRVVGRPWDERDQGPVCVPLPADLLDRGWCSGPGGPAGGEARPP